MTTEKTNEPLKFEQWIETQTPIVIGGLLFFISTIDYYRLSLNHYVALFKIVKNNENNNGHNKLQSPVLLELENDNTLILM